MFVLESIIALVREALRVRQRERQGFHVHVSFRFPGAKPEFPNVKQDSLILQEIHILN